MKNKIFSLVLAVCLLLVMALPVIANSVTWSFTMDLRVVDGDKNGVYHNMTAGTMKLTGNIWAYSKDSSPDPTPNKVYIEVWESKDWAVDRKISVVPYATPSILLNSKVPISNGNLGTQPAGKYYSLIWKIEDDKWNIKGSGSLTTS